MYGVSRKLITREILVMSCRDEGQYRNSSKQRRKAHSELGEGEDG